ncbi:MAG: 4'-phosphopantetheinyl transferase superfamily protein [Treponema sp.]|nr:4'-phosphopantetheinyl transferase superfamily protein [Treponema sp.]
MAPLKNALSAEARRILALLDRNGSGGKGLRLRDTGTEPGGRPFFTDYHADFNISHSRNMAAVAWSAAINPSTALPFRTGCDIQYMGPGKNKNALAREYFSPEESAFITGASDPPVSGDPVYSREQKERFYQIWVLKECYLKAKGLSVLDIKKAPSFAAPSGFQRFIETPFFFYLYELGDEIHGRFMLAAACETERPAHYPREPAAEVPVRASPPAIRWFGEALPLRYIASINGIEPQLYTYR